MIVSGESAPAAFIENSRSAKTAIWLKTPIRVFIVPTASRPVWSFFDRFYGSPSLSNGPVGTPGKRSES
jgi:hypothetical protein